VLGRGTIPDTDVYSTACAESLSLAAGRRTLRRVGLSLGLSITADVRDAIVELDADEWWEAIEGDDETRDGAWLGEISEMSGPGGLAGRLGGSSSAKSVRIPAPSPACST